jgi:hypothetical protein
MAYMSVSSYKNYLDCEAMALASDKGEYVRPQTNECLVGSYLHSWNEGAEALDNFKSCTPDMFNKNGSMKAAFLFADQMIETLQNDPFCMYMLEGLKEQIITAEMFGTMWKIKIDTLKVDDSIIDLKSTRSIWELQWNNFYKCKVSFLEQYNYFRQLAVYCEVERLASGRATWLTPYIVAVSKETPPDKAVISLEDNSHAWKQNARFSDELMLVEANLPRILQVKAGEVEPVRCGRCAYCRASSGTTEIISYHALEDVV